VTTDTVSPRPYSPSFIQAFYAALDRLPIPAWLFFVLLIPIVGITQHLVAWRKGALASGQFNFDLGTAGYYLGTLVIGIYVLKGAPKALDEYRPLLNVTEEEYARLHYEISTIPNGLGTLIFLVGVAGGAVSGFSDMAVAPALVILEEVYEGDCSGKIWTTGCSAAQRGRKTCPEGKSSPGQSAGRVRKRG
jgi:hypothetical protein